MNISTLEAYVAQKNQWTRIFKGKELSLLRAEVSRRVKMLSRCAEELLGIDSSVTFYEMGV